MVAFSKREYLKAIRPRYRLAGRLYKQRILDEFCRICGYHRKHAIRLLRKNHSGRQRRPGRPSVYGKAERDVLEVIWLTANRPCSRRLQAALPLWLPYYEAEYGRLGEALNGRLRAISPRSLDRLLTPVRRRHGTRGRCGTRPGTFLLHQIPIRTTLADVHKPGVMEADTVAHCGDSLEGSFVWSLTLTDVFSGWTQNRAIWNKGYAGVQSAIAHIETELPFRLTGFHSDNGGEFLNHHLFRYFSDRGLPVDFSRGRPYQKDDNPHVEQKNYTHVRLLLGYSRIEDETLIPKINALYHLWALFNNFFCPSLKLAAKTKIGSHYAKTYDTPRTPHQRLMDSTDVNEAIKTHLTELACNLNPFSLKRQIDHHQRQILNTLR